MTDRDEAYATGELCSEAVPGCACLDEEPTDRDYVEGRARFTSVTEWAQTGRRLAWR